MSSPLDPNLPATSLPPRMSDHPPVFALVIGIDKYVNMRWDQLTGAVADADSFQRYLQEDLRVPPLQIRNLRNKEATRAAIIQNLQDLAADTRIAKGDPIVIFYAGHGGTAKAPEGWEAGGSKIQMIIPYDCQPDTKDPKEWHGIPDRTIGALLENIADAHSIDSETNGSNITVIFDCCHSGSGTRGQRNPQATGGLARCVKLPDNVPADLDKSIWSKNGGASRGDRIPSGFLHAGLRSHVLLAACTEEQSAYELSNGGAGRFTVALLQALRKFGADKVTYRDLIQRMDVIILEKPKQQNPQCEGVNQDRIVFNSKVSCVRRDGYEVHMKDSKYIMDAGAVHGITNGSEFNVYNLNDRDNLPNAPLLGTLVAFNVDVFTTDMLILNSAPPFALAPSELAYYALQTRGGDDEQLLLHVARDAILAPIFGALEEESKSKGRRISIKDKSDGADLDVELEEGSVYFNISNSRITHHGFTRIPHPVPPNINDLRPVILGMAHYNWHLRREKDTSCGFHLSKFVTLEAHKLTHIGYEENSPRVKLGPKGGNCIVDGVFKPDVIDKKAKYGFKVTSTLEADLYVYLFFFNSSDMSITSYYQPSSAKDNKVYPPLKQRDSFTMNYHSGGDAPRSYSVDGDAKIEVGYLKLFIATDYIDLSNVPQDTPFPVTGQPRGDRPAEPDEHVAFWDTIVIPVVLGEA